MKLILGNVLFDFSGGEYPGEHVEDTLFDTITLNTLLASIDEHLVKLDKDFDRNYIKFTSEDYKPTISGLDFNKKLENCLKKEK